MADSTAARPATGGAAAAKGTLWQLLAQLVPLVANLFLTPFVITSLGRTGYGIWLLASALSAMLVQLDGGIGRTAQFYFSRYAGAGDRVAATRLTCTLLVLAVAFSVISLTPVLFAAPWLAGFFHAPPEFTQDTVFLLRVMTGLVALSFIRNVFWGLLYGHGRYPVTSGTIILGHGAYAFGLVVFLSADLGLRGVAFAFLLQQGLGTALVIPVAARHLTRRGIGWTDRLLIRGFLRTSWRVQATALLGLAGLQGTTLLVGRLRPQQLADFGPGATFAQQLRLIPMNAVIPIQTTLGRAVGQSGAADTVPLFERIQRIWVIAVTGWVAVGAPAAYFGVNAWLPLETNIAGGIAATMLAAHLLYLVPQALVQFALVLDRPGLELRSSLVSVWGMFLLSLVLVPLMGVMGVAVATVVAQGGALILLAVMRRRLPVAVSNPLRRVPWAAAVVCSAFSLGTQLGAQHWLGPSLHGIRGLLLCALAAAVPMIGYLIWGFGPGAVASAGRAVRRRWTR